jgi:hypothetical protein
MAYTINKFDGSLLTTVADGTLDTAATDIKLVGKNFTGYGEIMNENYIHMLENFADSTAPTAPLTGQIWWNTALGTLTVWDGTQFKAVSSSTVSTTAPTGAVEGDLWWDSDDEQLYVYNGTSWVLVGPSASAGVGQSGSVVEIVTDDTETDRVVVTTYVDGIRVAIASSYENAGNGFTPNATWVALLNGFTTIEPGINLVDGVTEIPGARYHGVAYDSDRLGTLLPASYIRSDDNDETTGTLRVNNDTGFYVGVGATPPFQIGVTGTTPELYGRVAGENLIIGATEAGSAQRQALTYDPDAQTVSFANGLANNELTNILDPVSAQSAVTKKWFEDQLDFTSGDGVLNRNGTNTITGSITPNVDGTHDLGTALLQYNEIFAVTFTGVASSANYADLAERFEADSAMAPGTVVMLGGVEEITQVNEELSDDIFGVISTQPGYLMNAAAGSNETHPPVAMSGRVPVRVIGEVSKGDRLVSAGNGLARAATKDELTSFNVIGRSLEDKEGADAGIVEAIVHMNS